MQYVARNRVMGDLVFDFQIADEVGKDWYDHSPNQWMPERQWCIDHIKPGYNILDCGAHHGMMSVIFSLTTGPSGRVIAYEALPANAGVIERNALLNGLTNITVRPLGIGAERKTVRCRLNSGNINVMADGTLIQADSVTTIEVVSLDADVDPALHVDFLKIDVEGSDLDALRGMPRILRQRPIIDLEIHNFVFKDRLGMLTDIFDILYRGKYLFEVLPEIASDVVKVGGAIDLLWLARFDNPHVFCIPA